jgi:thioredoxin-dependent peroxiredoxin
MADSISRLPSGHLIASNGSTIDLAELIGKPVVIYFYPKADTPGCTTEAKDFSELMPDFDAIGVRVIAVSKDSPKKLAKFSEKYSLGVILASDEAGDVTERFGAWVEKSMYGKNYMGIDRSTFLFAADGVLVRDWRKVKVKGHAADVLAAARAI